MSNSSSEYFGADTWWVHVNVTATGSTDLRTIPTATRTGTGGTRRAVVQGWSLNGHNTNAAATTISVRNKTTTTTVFKGASMAPTTGSVNSEQNHIWLPGAANETIELVVGGALTGVVDLVLWGRYIAADSAFMSRNVTGAATP